VNEFPYASPRAFDAALTARFKNAARESSFTAAQLRRQFAYDRLLARCFTGPDATQWILKGGISMLARLGTARHSADVDLAAIAATPAASLVALSEVVSADLGDFFGFKLAKPTNLVQGIDGVRVPVTANLGPRLYESFHVDLVTAATMTGPAEIVPAIADPGVPGLVRPDYRIYPLADSVADKICAIIERHNGLPSTRFRDLVDLVLVSRSRAVDARALCIALNSERRRRALADSSRFDVPDREMWETGYARVAARAPGLDGFRTLHEALAVVTPFVDPIVTGGRTAGRWNPATGDWA